MNMKFILLCIAFVLACCSCDKKSSGELQVYKLNFNQLSDKGFDEFYRLKEVIRLETNDSSVMPNVMKVVAAKDRIFISTWSRSHVLVFDRQGKYITKIDKQGRGAGEYQRVQDFMVAEQPEEIIIYAPEGRLIFYDWNGHFLREEKRDRGISNMERLPDGGWLTNHAFLQLSRFQDSSFVLRVAAPDGKYVAGKIALPSGLNPVLPVTMVSSFYQDRGRYYAAPITDNTIYEYDCGKAHFIPRYAFDFVGGSLPDINKITYEDLKRNFVFDYYMLSAEYIGEKTVLCCAFYGRRSEMMYVIAGKKEEWVYGFNKLDDKENELPLNRYMQHGGFAGNIIVYASPLEIKEWEFKTETSVGYKLSRELDDEDNPVLLVYEEK